MKLGGSRSLESRLFWVGALLLVLTGLLYGLFGIVSEHGHPRDQVGNPGIAAASVVLGLAEFTGSACLLLSALISIFRTFLPSKPK